jgi:hypothetical protein
MYVSTPDGVRSGICNVGPRRVGDRRRDDGDYVESGAPASSDSGPKIGFSTATPHKTVLQIMSPATQGAKNLGDAGP